MHVAIIMDGNGRWATARGLPRVAGHRRGADAVRRVVEAAPRLGISTLTLYAFSADNWRRPAAEVDTLLGLFDQYLHREVRRAIEAGLRLEVIGRRDRLPPSLARRVAAAEAATAGGTTLRLRLAIDYSAREAIWTAARAWCAAGEDSREALAARLRSGRGEISDAPDVDLLIRSGGEARLSDFLLWECAYAELWFTDVAWPEFGAAELEAALDAFARRERRFGGLGAGHEHARRAVLTLQDRRSSAAPEEV
jgi:undecaprenyl diphosphate synthase